MQSALKILCIEDHPDSARAISKLLSKNGHAVTLARGYSEALNSAVAHDFDVVIVDIGLPDGNGLDFVADLKHCGKKSYCIALSGYGLPDDILRGVDAGFDYYLVKPIQFADLLKVLDNFGKFDTLAMSNLNRPSALNQKIN